MTSNTFKNRDLGSQALAIGPDTLAKEGARPHVPWHFAPLMALTLS